MSIAVQPAFGFYEDGANSRTFHESRANVEDALSCLRKHPLAKQGWERRIAGARLAPAIEILRNGYGFHISGNGSLASPYQLLDCKQWPTKVRTTNEIKLAYYASSHWESVRNKRFSHDGYRCVVCVGMSSEEIQCHHVRYQLFAEPLDDLVTVCKYHHKLIHEHSRIGFPVGVSLQFADALVGYHEFEEWLKP